MYTITQYDKGPDDSIAFCQKFPKIYTYRPVPVSEVSVRNTRAKDWLMMSR